MTEDKLTAYATDTPARYAAQDKSGEWWLYEVEPYILEDRGLWDSRGWKKLAYKGKTPAGHDWQATLREVKHVKREFNPTSSSLTDSQACAMAAEVGACSDGAPCRPNYCDGCPNAPEDESEWVLLDRRLNGRDAINPGHYKAGKVECIDALEAATFNKSGIEAVCTANAIKYLWRYESKNGLEDVRKARWYLDRLAQHLGE